MADRTLIGLSLYSLLSSNRSGIFLVFFPVFMVTVDHAPVALTLAFSSAAYVAGSLVQPLAGRWSDRIGRRRPFLVGGELGAVPLYLSIPFLPGYIAAGLAFVAGTTVLSMGGPALNAYVADVTRDRQRGGAYGLLNAASSGGGIAGFVIVGLLVLDLGFRSLFYFVALVQLGTLAVLLVRVPDDRTIGTPAHRPLREMKEVAFFSTTVSVRSLGAGAVGAFYGIYASRLGANLFEVSLVAIAGLLTMAVASVPVGRLVDAIGEIRGLLWGTALSIVGIVAFLVATNWLLLLPAQGFRNLGFAFLGPAMLSWVARLAPANRRAEYLGVFSLINSTLWSLGPLAGGLAISLAGAPGVFVFSIGATAVSLVAIEGFYVRGRRGRAGHRPDEGPSRPSVTAVGAAGQAEARADGRIARVRPAFRSISRIRSRMRAASSKSSRSAARRISSSRFAISIGRRSFHFLPSPEVDSSPESASSLAAKSDRTSLTIVSGTMPWARLYSSWRSRRRLVSAMARPIDPVTRSA